MCAASSNSYAEDIRRCVAGATGFAGEPTEPHVRRLQGKAVIMLGRGVSGNVNRRRAHRGGQRSWR